MNVEKLTARAKALGATNTAVVSVADIVFDTQFRTLCERNACGKYHTNYTCPPLCGTIEACMERVRRYQTGVIVQLIAPLEDSFDWEGMIKAKDQHVSIMCELKANMAELVPNADFFALGAGGCSVCEQCGCVDGIPCRHPDQKMSSVEAYGMDVTQLARLGNLPFSWSEAAVYYIGIFLF